MVAQTQAPRRRLRAALLAGLAALALALPCEARHRANAPAPAPQSVVASYQTRIHPILVTKCAACHTGTLERPLYYFIPVLNLWSQPFIEDHIRQGRVQFDFSNGFPAGRVGAAHEFIARLRNSVQDRSMPPLEYSLVHWTHRLTEDERKAILSWAEAGIAALNTVRSSREMASVDAPEIPAQIAAAIAQACPLADRKDARARDACAERLARSEILKARMQEPFLWGGQDPAEGGQNVGSQVALVQAGGHARGHPDGAAGHALLEPVHAEEPAREGAGFGVPEARTRVQPVQVLRVPHAGQLRQDEHAGVLQLSQPGPDRPQPHHRGPRGQRDAADRRHRGSPRPPDPARARAGLQANRRRGTQVREREARGQPDRAGPKSREIDQSARSGRAFQK